MVSGMLSTVSVSQIKKDENGRDTGYVITDDGSKFDVYKNDENWYRTEDGTMVDESLVTPYYEYSIGSYITQEVSSITLSVVNSDEIASAIRIGIVDDSATMSLISDKIALSGDTILGAMSAKTANIGGISIGNGKITTVSGDDDSTGMASGQTSTFCLDGTTGGFSANGAYIKGEIIADSGKIGGFDIDGSLLKVKSGEPGKTNDTIALLNGSDYLINENKGGLIIAAGINKSMLLYRYTTLEYGNNIPNEIFIDTRYTVSSSTTSTYRIKAYSANIDNETKKITSCNELNGDFRYEI
jgi:hypothetical protein